MCASILCNAIGKRKDTNVIRLAKEMEVKLQNLLEERIGKIDSGWQEAPRTILY